MTGRADHRRAAAGWARSSISRVAAPQYLLGINPASGPRDAGARPLGSEAFFELSGKQSIHGLLGVQRVQSGQPESSPLKLA